MKAAAAILALIGAPAMATPSLTCALETLCTVLEPGVHDCEDSPARAAAIGPTEDFGAQLAIDDLVLPAEFALGAPIDDTAVWIFRAHDPATDTNYTLESLHVLGTLWVHQGGVHRAHYLTRCQREE